MATFITPYTGQAQLTVSNGLQIVDQAAWRFQPPANVDGITFGVTLANEYNADSGELHLRAVNWTIAEIGNSLTSYTDPETHITYPASQCQISVTGRWQIRRTINTASNTSQGVLYNSYTLTDQGDRLKAGTWYTPYHTFVIQGADVDGGAINTFSDHEFFCRIKERTATRNTNGLYVSNTIASPVWAYTYSKSWQTAA
jgi:hypothetical protein